MGKADEADAAEVLRLQGLLRQEHADLETLGENGQGRAEQMTAVFAATNKLLALEAEMPQRRDARRRKVSSVIVYGAGCWAVAAMLIEVALMLAGRVSWGYLFPAAPVGLLAGGLAVAERNAPVRGHASRAGAAITAMVAAVIVVVVSAGFLSRWALLAVVAALAVVISLWISAGDETDTKEAR